MGAVQLLVSQRYDTKISMHTSTHSSDVRLSQEFQNNFSNASRTHCILYYGKHKKWSSEKKRTNIEYHVKNNEYIQHKYVKIYCTTNQFPEFQFCGPQNKPYDVHRLIKHCHMRFDPKILHVIRAIHYIPCVRTQCTSTLDKIWTPDVSPFSP